MELYEQIDSSDKPEHFNADTAARCMHYALGAAYMRADVGDNDTPHRYKMYDAPGGVALAGSYPWESGGVFIHSSHELIVKVENDGDVLVAFRGSSDLEDFIVDLSSFLVDPDPLLRQNGDAHLGKTDSIKQLFTKPFGRKMHRGFALRATEHINFVTTCLIKLLGREQGLQKVKKIVVTGHSLGGAAAMAFAYLFKLQADALNAGESINFIDPLKKDEFFNKITHPYLVLNQDAEFHVYAFSAPRIANRALQQHYDEILPNTFGMYWGADVVPQSTFFLWEVGWRLSMDLVDPSRFGITSLASRFKLIRLILDFHMQVPVGMTHYLETLGAGKALDDAYEEVAALKFIDGENEKLAAMFGRPTFQWASGTGSTDSKLIVGRDVRLAWLKPLDADRSVQGVGDVLKAMQDALMVFIFVGILAPLLLTMAVGSVYTLISSIFGAEGLATEGWFLGSMAVILGLCFLYGSLVVVSEALTMAPGHGCWNINGLALFTLSGIGLLFYVVLSAWMENGTPILAEDLMKDVQAGMPAIAVLKGLLLLLGL